MSMNVQMLREIREVADNNQLIEVEIYNGSSNDIIWQNTHSDYRKIANQMKEEENRGLNEKVWDWGNIQGGLDGSGEIWEDELGSFKATLFDNCKSKNKYLALKRLERKRRARR